MHEGLSSGPPRGARHWMESEILLERSTPPEPGRHASPWAKCPSRRERQHAPAVSDQHPNRRLWICNHHPLKSLSDTRRSVVESALQPHDPLEQERACRHIIVAVFCGWADFDIARLQGLDDG